MNANEHFRLSYEVIHGASLSISVLSASWMSWELCLASLHLSSHSLSSLPCLWGLRRTGHIFSLQLAPCLFLDKVSALNPFLFLNPGEWGYNSRAPTFIFLDKDLKQVQLHCPSHTLLLVLRRTSHKRQPPKQKVPLDRVSPRRNKSVSNKKNGPANFLKTQNLSYLSSHFQSCQ